MKNRLKLWKTLAFVTLPLSIVFSGAVTVASTNASLKTLLDTNLHTGGVSIISDDTEDSEYFKSSFASAAEREKYENALCEQVEAEGATLLMNENGALPLASGSKVSLFSHSSANIIYGGTGSGSMAISQPLTLKKVLTDQGIEVNDALWKFYTEGAGSEEKYNRVNAATTGGKTGDYRLNEVPWSVLESGGATSSISAYGDAAIMVLARSGGEGADLPYGQGIDGCEEGCEDATNGDYLLLSPHEKEILSHLSALKTAGTIKKIIVLLNYSNAMQLDFLQDPAYGIDAALWIGGVGQTGLNAVGKILSGAVVPSGRLPDTFLLDNHSMPAMKNFGVYEFTDKEARGLDVGQNNTENGVAKGNSRYVVYEEGIYIGYRYYETRYEDYVLGTAGAGNYDYASEVAYPFGYGLSYTTFSYSDFVLSEGEEEYVVNVKVTNTGDLDALHTVQAYFQSPYTAYDMEHGIEKSAVELCGFQKKEVKKGETVAYSISIPKNELRTYDAYGQKTYIQDAGDYYFAIGSDAHDAINNILSAKGIANERMDDMGNANLVGKVTIAEDGVADFSKSPETGYEITNQFDDADINLYEGDDRSTTYLSRSNWTGTLADLGFRNFKVSDAMWADGLAPYLEEAKEALVKQYEERYWASAALPQIGQAGSLKAINFKGVPYDGKYKDPSGVEHGWNELLSQMTYSELTDFIGNGFHVTKAVPSIGLPNTRDENGPQGFTLTLASGGSGMAYTSEDIMAATYNEELLRKVGECIGEDCLAASNAKARYSGLYGPACNIHRTPYSGRNFEYFSEDGFLSKKMCAKEVSGIQSKGIYVFTKHAILNDQENGRMGIATFANEQSIREIYLEGFEGSVIGGGSGVMTSFNRLGVTWAGAHYGLMTNVLRNEFGMIGSAITDCSMFATYMDYRLGLLAGQNLWDGYTMGEMGNQLKGHEKNPAMLSAMLEAAHRNIYSIVNSMAMNGISSSSKMVQEASWWQTGLIALSAGLGVVGIASVVMWIITKKRMKAE